ncbi:MAG: hypothetical protein GY805_04195, partial [Chloroflexi bacterium]|nr:hypothetical protein [Chloroflexota bacterium]
MMRTPVFTLIASLMLIFLLTSCRLTAEAEAAVITPPVTLTTLATEPIPTATAQATETIRPSATWTPLATATAPATLTPQPTQTNTPTATPMPTATETAVPINRLCPNPAPQKPAYTRYFLAAEVWPQPLTSESI